MYIICQLSVPSYHIRSTPRTNLWVPEDGQDMRPKHVAVVYNKRKNIVQKVGAEIYVYSYLLLQ
jgi:hypothetical protein